MGNYYVFLQGQPPTRLEEYRQLFRLPPDEVTNYIVLLLSLFDKFGGIVYVWSYLDAWDERRWETTYELYNFTK